MLLKRPYAASLPGLSCPSRRYDGWTVDNGIGGFCGVCRVDGYRGPRANGGNFKLEYQFLRRPAAADMIGEARIAKTTKRLAFAEVHLFMVGEDPPIDVTSTYAIPKAVKAS